MSGTRRIVISALALAVASAVVGLVMVTSRSSSLAMAGMSGMSGMDHGSGDTSTASPVAADAGGMPGMDMSGMDSGTRDVTASQPPPTPSGDMPGMDMPGMDSGTGDVTASPPPPTGSGEMPGMDMPGMDMPGMDHVHGTAAESAPDRPLAPVLGTFGGGTSAVLFAAGFMRRKDRAASLAKKATRLTRKAKK